MYTKGHWPGFAEWRGNTSASLSNSLARSLSVMNSEHGAASGAANGAIRVSPTSSLEQLAPCPSRENENSNPRDFVWASFEHVDKYFALLLMP